MINRYDVKFYVGDNNKTLVFRAFLINRATCKFKPSKQLNSSHSDF